MTISDAYVPASYTANGTAAETFNIPFPFSANSEIVLLEAGVIQTQGTIYTVTGAGLSTGGTATYVGAPAAAAAILINRVVPLDQNVDLQETGPFSAESVEGGLDTQVQQVQQSLQRNTTDGNTFDAKTLKIVNVVDPTAAQDAATKAYVDAIVISSGNLPTPVDPDDDGKHIEANSGVGAWAVTEEVPTPTAGNVSGEHVLTAATAAVNGAAFQEVPARGGRARNLLMNGQFNVAQHGAGPFTSATVPLNSDNTNVLDRWRLLSDGNDAVDVSQSTAAVPVGAMHSILLDVETANKKFGILQMIEKRDTVLAFGSQTGSVSISFEAFTPTGSSIGALMVGVVSWTGTADATTGDPVSAWNAAGAVPDLDTGSGWEFENTPATLALTANSWTTYTVTGVPLDLSGIENIGIFIWVDDTVMTAGHFLYISNVQMVMGSVVGQYGFRPYAEELALCERYLQVIAAAAVEEPFCGAGINITDVTSSFVIPLTTTMRAKPTAVAVGSAATDFRVASLATVDACSAITFATATPKSVKLDATHAAVTTVGDSVMLEAVNANAKLTFSAEM
jgi:hypothetical protein